MNVQSGGESRQVCADGFAPNVVSVRLPPLSISANGFSVSSAAGSFAETTIFRFDGSPVGPGFGSRIVRARPRSAGGSVVELVLVDVDVLVVVVTSTSMTNAPLPPVPA